MPPNVRIVRPDPTWPPGHDVADLIAAGWDHDRISAFIAPNTLTASEFLKLADGTDHQQQNSILARKRRAGFGPSPRLSLSGRGTTQAFYRPLGYDRGAYFVLSHESQQIHEFTAATARTALLGFAPLAYWAASFPRDRGGVDWPAAADSVIRECYACGVYQPAHVRGRGVWLDGDRIVIHLGDHLIVNGVQTRPSDIAGRFVYPAGAPVGFHLVPPATDDQAYLIYRTANEFLWERGIYGALFAGWLALAPLCGALSWRPHLWLTGGAGSGKSTVERDFMIPMLAGFALTIQGGSTEAGIRQRLHGDALPVIFDEAGDTEQLTDAMKARINAILDLMRASSTQAAGSLVKGSTTHHAVVFELNSAFCLSSVLVPNMNDADASRITVLRLRALTEDERQADPNQWPRLSAQLRAVRDLGPAFVARNLRMLPAINDNVSTFTQICAGKLRNQRLGDQYGTMLAAAYTMLPADLRVSPEAWIEELDWEEYQPDPTTRDEFKCLSAILETVIQLKDDDRGITRERSVLELIRIAADVEEVRDGHVSPAPARLSMARHGLAVIRKRDKPNPYLFVAATHRAIAGILRNTRWAAGWSLSLRRIKNSIGNDVQQLEGRAMKGVSIPLSAFLDNSASNQVN